MKTSQPRPVLHATKELRVGVDRGTLSGMEPPIKPDLGDRMEAGLQQAGATLAVAVIAFLIGGLVGVIGGLMGLPHIVEIVGVIWVLGLGVTAYVAKDTNLSIRLAQERARQRLANQVDDPSR